MYIYYVKSLRIKVTINLDWFDIERLILNNKKKKVDFSNIYTLKCIL